MKTKFSKLISYGIITVIIAFGISTTAAAQSGNQPPLPVKVTNAEPIPVSGTVTVASSPSTPLTVTGNVNVAGQVTVANATNTALNVRDLNTVKKMPIQLRGSCFSDEPITGCAEIIRYYGGPTGSRGKVVIQTCLEDLGCNFRDEDRRPSYYLEPTGTGSNWSDYGGAVASEKVVIFGNDKAAVIVYGQCSPGPTCYNNFYLDVTMSGWLIDKPY